MNGDWFYAKGGQKFGPFAFEQLRQVAASGLLSPEDMVQDGSTGRWLSAGAVEGLFGAAAPQSAATPARRDAPTQSGGPPPLAARLSAWATAGWFVALIAADAAIACVSVCVWLGLDYTHFLGLPAPYLAAFVAAVAAGCAGSALLAQAVLAACGLGPDTGAGPPTDPLPTRSQ